MSDITKLTEKIIQDAEKKYQQQVKDAKKDIEEQEQIKKNQLKKLQEERLQAFEKEKRGEMYLQISDVHIQSRNKVLAAKQSVLDELFVQALKQLNEISAEDFNHFVVNGLQEAPFEGEVELMIGENSVHFLTKENQSVWQTKKPAGLTLMILGKTIPKRGGFVLRQEEIELNYTFEALLETEKEELSNTLLQLIFEQ